MRTRTSVTEDLCQPVAGVVLALTDETSLTEEELDSWQGELSLLADGPHSLVEAVLHLLKWQQEELQTRLALQRRLAPWDQLHQYHRKKVIQDWRFGGWSLAVVEVKYEGPLPPMISGRHGMTWQRKMIEIIRIWGSNHQ